MMCRLFVAVGETNECRLARCAAEQLQAGGETIVRKSHRNGDRWKSRVGGVGL